MKKICAPVGLILTAILISNCTQVSERPGTGKIKYPIPEPPGIQEPEPISLPSNLQNRCSGGEVLISSDTDSARFEGCTVFVKESGISITRSEFINSRIFFEFVSDVVFSDNVVRDYSVHEEAAITVGVSENIVLRHNHICGPDPGSFTRDVSPLSEENAGPSIVSYQDNHVFKNNENVIEEETE